MADEDKESARRFQEQCILMANWKELVHYNQERTGRDQFNVGQSTEGGNFQQYTNFVAIDHSKPYEFMNVLFKKSDKAELLLTMKNEQLSLLVPRLQFFKYYKDPSSGEEIEIEMPFEDFMSASDVRNITKSVAGRGGGAGIKSFEWTSLGKQEEEKHQFGASLTIHLQGVEELFKIRSVRTLPSGKVVEMRYSDLILHQASLRHNENEGSGVWNPEYFRLKVVAGWVVPELKGYQKFFGNEMLDALRETTVSLFMVLTDHEIDFQEDGTIELKINFIAGEEMAIANPQTANVLFPSKEYQDERKSLQRRISNLRKKIRNLGYEINFGGSGARYEDSGIFGTAWDYWFGSGGDPDTEIGFTRNGSDVQNPTEIALLRRFIELTKEFNRLPDTPRGQTYPRILEELLGSNRIYSVNVKQKFLNKEVKTKGVGEGEPSGEEAQKTSEEYNEAIQMSSEIRGGVSLAGFNEIPTEEETQKERVSRLVREMRDLTEVNINISEDERTIYFFYLGDLLDITLRGMFTRDGITNDNFFNKDVKVLLGPISFIDYGNIEKVGQVTRSTGVKNTKSEGNETVERWRGEFTSLNIADIPVSLSVFVNWFNKTIVETGAQRYSFKKFLSSVVNDLVIRAVSHQCYDLAPEQQARVSFKTFSVPRNEKRDQFFSLGRIELEEILRNKLEFKVGRQSAKENEKFDKYVLVYGIKEPPYDLTTDYFADRKRGIYHLYYGDEKGLVKKIRFNKSDLPFLEESNTVNQTKEGGEISRILRKRYNSTIEMFGNSMFDVGQILHINPTVMGSGDASVRLKKIKELGIGGYFQVINHTNRIEAGVFQTDLKTEWVATGDGTTNIQDKRRGDVVIRKGKQVKSVKKTSDVAQIVETDAGTSYSVQKKSERAQPGD